MECKKIVAIVRGSALERVEERLKQVGIKGISVTRVKGFGEYANLFKEDRMVDHVRIAIFAPASCVDGIVAAIMDSAHLGIPGDGLVAVQPVDKIYRIRTKAEIKLDEC